MNKSGILFLIFAITVFIVFTWLNSTWLSYRGYELTQNVKKIDYYLSDFTLLNTYPDGSMRYQLKGSNLVHQQATGASKIFNPVLQARSLDNSIITLSSKKAIQDKKNGDIQLQGEVSVNKTSTDESQNFKLLTTDLLYKPDEKEISSNQALTFTSNMGNIRGVGFNTNLNQQELRIHNNVQAEFIPAK